MNMDSFERKILKDVKKSWRNTLKELLRKHKIFEKLDNSKVIFPNTENIFETFKYFNLDNLKLVFLGQDPYIGEEIHNKVKIPQAQGLAFSVPETHKIPPSLVNIFKELKLENENYKIQNNGNLIRWVKEENILLLNTALTVIKGESNSHQKIWNNFTNDLIEYISDNTDNVIFLLLGNNAKSKEKYIDEDKHIIITGVHPSPLSANRGFFNSNIFNRINEKLSEINKKKINW